MHGTAVVYYSRAVMVVMMVGSVVMMMVNSYRRMPDARSMSSVDDLNVSLTKDDLPQSSKLKGSPGNLTSVSVRSVQEIEDAQVFLTSVQVTALTVSQVYGCLVSSSLSGVSLSVSVVNFIKVVGRGEQVATANDGLSRADGRSHSNVLRNIDNSTQVSPASEGRINNNVAAVTSSNGEGLSVPSNVSTM
jgi:hypothetical protein